MNPIFQMIAQETVIENQKRKTFTLKPTKKDAVKFKLHIHRPLIEAGFIFVGILSAGLGLKGFLLPNNFIDGGVTGMSLLVSEITGVPLSLLIVIINIPYIYLGYRNIG